MQEELRSYRRGVLDDGTDDARDVRLSELRRDLMVRRNTGSEDSDGRRWRAPGARTEYTVDRGQQADAPRREWTRETPRSEPRSTETERPHFSSADRTPSEPRSATPTSSGGDVQPRNLTRGGN
jgi:hypothetical protein